MNRPLGKLKHWTKTLTGTVARALDSDLFYSFKRSPATIAAALCTLLILVAVALASWLAPQNPFNPSQLSLLDSLLPPAWMDGGNWSFPLGSDDQGRCILSTIMYGSRISLIVGFAAVVLSGFLGISLGVLSGYLGGWVDAVAMRMADIQLTVPGILVALVIDGIARAALPRQAHDELAIFVIIIAIGLADWPQYARVTRGASMVEKNMDYVSAAKVIGIHPARIMLQHILPNVVGGMLVLATISLAHAIIIEATLSFLGVGMPPTTPSLGTLIRIGNDYLFSGEWWITLFPSLTLVLMVLAVTLLGEWLRDALNPKLR